MDLSAGIQRLLDGEAVLFLGAGFSLGAANLRAKPFMSGKVIVDHFAALTGLPPGSGLEDAAGHMQKTEVQEEFTAREVASHHRRVAALPWKRVSTTNYDNVFEVASRLERQRITSVTMGSDIYKFPKDHRICVHLNGYIAGDIRRYHTRRTNTTNCDILLSDCGGAQKLRFGEE